MNINSWFGQRAFLPDEDPICQLPDDFYAWEAMAIELPGLLAAAKARDELSKIKLLEPSALQNKAQQERALGLLSVFGHAAIHESWRTGSHTVVPKSIAKPWVSLAQKMGRYPVLTYASHGLNNWRRLDVEQPIEVGNIVPQRIFFGGLDEAWFICSHVEVEARATPIVRAIDSGMTAAKAGDADALKQSLQTLVGAISSMRSSLKNVRRNCDPHIFFTRVQPFMQGMKNVIYEGAEEFNNKPQNFPGGSGAQSTILPILDGFLGVTHAEDTLISYLYTLRKFMPAEHRMFLERAETESQVRMAVLNSEDVALIHTYNSCIEELGAFRADHLEIAIEYIHKPARSMGGQADTGTGGSPFVSYLKKHREETFNHTVNGSTRRQLGGKVNGTVTS